MTFTPVVLMTSPDASAGMVHIPGVVRLVKNGC